jgi:uncharacterized protein
MDTTENPRPPVPPFTSESAAQKVRMAEDGWNTQDPVRVALAYTPDSIWRNRSEFLQGRAQIEAFLAQKWLREQEYRLVKELWAFTGNRIASINDLPIQEADRKLRWSGPRRPDAYPSLSELGL